MKKEKGPVTKLWLQARHLIETKQLEEAEQVLDKGILVVSKYTLDGLGDKDLLEGVKMETWKERFWIAIENNIWPTRKDYEKNWKCC
jgi:hypothetical protein